MGLRCFLVFELLFLARLSTVGTEVCYTLSTDKKSIDQATPDRTDDGVTISNCAANVVVSDPFVIVAGFGNEACVIFSSIFPSREPASEVAMFVNNGACEKTELCTLLDINITGAHVLPTGTTEDDCVYVCRYGSNCVGVSWESRTDTCYWSDSTNLTSNLVTDTDFRSYVKCHLAPTTTSTTSTTTTTTITTSTTTTPTTRTTASTTTTTTQTMTTTTLTTTTTTSTTVMTTMATTTTTTTASTITTSTTTTDTLGPASPAPATTQTPPAISDQKKGLELETPTEAGSFLDLHRYGVDIQHCHSFVYQVKGCQDHGISLLDTDGAELASLVIGSDSNSMSGVSGELTVSTPDILSCNEFRWFWMKWSGNKFLYGSGMDTLATPTIDYTDDSILLLKRLGLKKINASPSVIRLGSNANSRVYKIFNAGKFADGEIEEFQVLSDMNCAIKCSKNPDCGMFSFNKAERFCSIVNRMTSSFIVTSSANWQSWTMLYCY